MDIIQSDDAVTLCQNCSRIFVGTQTLYHVAELVAAPNIDLTTPTVCRICLIIRRRHDQFMRNFNGKAHGLQLSRINYEFLRNVDNTRARYDGPERESLDLMLGLEYSNGDVVWLVLLMRLAGNDEETKCLHSLSNNTASQATGCFILDKFKECRKYHADCQTKDDGPSNGKLPTRVLEIGGEHNNRILLRNREDADETLPYMTLSHCWGSTNTTLLTKETEAVLRGGIDVSSLPKTFRDAVQITAMLDARYLWIDSMCIFQDQLDDWHAEAAEMGEVYWRATCNIAATGAENGSVGLFFERDVQVHCPFSINTHWKVCLPEHGFDLVREQNLLPDGMYEVSLPDECGLEIEHSPLNRRAWVMQERFLSTRTIHFTSSQVYWECMENLCSEAFPNELPLYMRPGPWLDSQSLKRGFFSRTWNDRCFESLYEAWQIFIRSYSRCRLSKGSDKLVAIDGIRKLISSEIDDELVAGLWRSRLLHELCWMRHDTTDDAQYGGHKETSIVQEWGAPTWSWASSNAGMHPGSVRHHVECHDFRSKAQVENIDVVETVSGQLRSAVLTLRGKMVRGRKVILRRAEDAEMKIPCINIGGHLDQDVELCHGKPLQVAFDDRDREVQSDEDIHCLVLFHCAENCTSPFRDEFAQPPFLFGLLLTPVKDREHTYTRLGVFEVDETSYSTYMEQEMEMEQRIMLV